MKDNKETLCTSYLSLTIFCRFMRTSSIFCVPMRRSDQVASDLKLLGWAVMVKMSSHTVKLQNILDSVLFVHFLH